MNAAWPVKKLRDIADIRVSNVDKKVISGEKVVRLCNYMDVYASEYIVNGRQFMEASATAAEIERFGLNFGDVIITKDSETPDDIGVPAVVVETIPELVCGYHLALVRPKTDQVDPIYLAKQLATHQVSRYFALNASGSTRYGLPVSKIEATEIPLAPLPEQAKIAEVLSTVDRTIEQMDALIAKQQRIKSGLMQELLTRGIDENGNLRSEHTHQFKNSPFGRIPVEWEVTALDRCAKKDAPICYGILMPGTGFDNGVPVIKVKDINGGQILQDQLLLTDPKIDNQYKRSRLRSGDLLVTIRGTTGRIALVPPELDMANITQDTARVRLKEAHSNQFFYFLMQAKSVQDQIQLHTLGQAVKGINITEVKKIRFGLPRPDEQHAIAERLSRLESALISSRRQLNKLRSLKTALMQDLLTGKTPVTPLLTPTEDTPDDRGQNP